MSVTNTLKSSISGGIPAKEPACTFRYKALNQRSNKNNDKLLDVVHNDTATGNEKKTYALFGDPSPEVAQAWREAQSSAQDPRFVVPLKSALLPKDPEGEPEMCSKIDEACARALGPSVAAWLEANPVPRGTPLLLPFPGALLASLVDAYYAKALPLASLDHCLLLLELAVYLGNDALALACLDYLETHAKAALLHPLKALGTWTFLSRLPERVSEAFKNATQSPSPTTVGLNAENAIVPPAGLASMPEDVSYRLVMLSDAIRTYCAEHFDVLCMAPIAHVKDLTRQQLEALLSSELRSTNESLVFRLVATWFSGDVTGRLAAFHELVRRYVRLALLPADTLLELGDKHRELAPYVRKALDQKAKLADRLIKTRFSPTLVEAAYKELGTRPAPELPATARVEIGNLRDIYGPSCLGAADAPASGPLSIVTPTFAIPGVPSLFYIRVDPVSKKGPEGKEKYASFYVYSTEATGGAVAFDLDVKVAVPMWNFTTSKTYRLKANIGMGATNGVPLPPAGYRIPSSVFSAEAEGAEQDTDAFLFTLTVNDVLYEGPEGKPVSGTGQAAHVLASTDPSSSLSSPVFGGGFGSLPGSGRVSPVSTFPPSMGLPPFQLPVSVGGSAGWGATKRRSSVSSQPDSERSPSPVGHSLLLGQLGFGSPPPGAGLGQPPSPSSSFRLLNRTSSLPSSPSKLSHCSTAAGAAKSPPADRTIPPGTPPASPPQYNRTARGLRPSSTLPGTGGGVPAIDGTGLELTFIKQGRRVPPMASMADPLEL